MIEKITWKEHVDARWDWTGGFPIVEVIWDDPLAKATAAWEETVTHEVAKVVSVGYLVYQDDEVLTIMSLIHSHAVGHGITIPLSAVYENGLRFL